MTARERIGRHGGGAAPFDLDAFERALAAPEVAPEESWRPLVISLAAGERGRLEGLCRARGLTLVDAFERQVEELAAVRLPAGSPAARRAFAAETVASHGDAAACGRWVHVPWERTVTHLLAPGDYFAVVTDRNRDKLTSEEQLRLRVKRVGVMGLSVGGEAAVALAQAHLCGAIALADFDALDLSNLNRLAAGFDELGRNKALLVARRIAKLDPYLRVDLYPEGVTVDNVDSFLDGLDLLVEECDGLAMKHEVRVRARARGLDVVFAGDERGFLSVEPYRQWPDLPPFHGRVTEPQPARESFVSARDYWRALAVWLGGWDALSERSRSSLERIGASLNGYPQLAGEARFAAGQIAHVARRLLLGETVHPFLGHLDLDRLLGPQDPPSGPGTTARARPVPSPASSG